MPACHHISNPYAVYQDFRRHLGPAIARAAYRISRTSLGAGLDARMVSVAFADGDYFRILGASAAFGRVLTPEDDPAPSGTPVIVLSDLSGAAHSHPIRACWGGR